MWILTFINTSKVLKILIIFLVDSGGISIILFGAQCIPNIPTNTIEIAESSPLGKPFKLLKDRDNTLTMKMNPCISYVIYAESEFIVTGNITFFNYVDS